MGRPQAIPRKALIALSADCRTRAAGHPRHHGTLPSPMTSASEAPASFRSSAVRPGPVGLVREGFRGRLLAAPAHPLPRPGGPQEEGRRHPPRQHLVGHRPAPPDGRLRGPRHAHLPAQAAGLPALHLRGHPALEVVQHCGQRRRRSVVMSERLIKQIQFPKLVLPVASAMSGIAELRLRPHPAGRPDAPLLPRPDLALAADASRSSPSSSSSSRCRSSSRSRPRTSSTATSATSPGMSCGCGSTCRRALRRSTSSVELTKEYPIVGTLMLLNPFTTLFTAYRAAIYDGTSPDWMSLLILVGLASILLLVARDVVLQARRAGLRQGALMAIGHIDEEHREGPVAIDARDLGVPLQPALHAQDADAHDLHEPPPAAQWRVVVLGAARGLVPGRAGRIAGRHRAERRRQEHAPPGPGGHHHALDRRGRGRRTRLQPADARGGLRPGPERDSTTSGWLARSWG